MREYLFTEQNVRPLGRTCFYEDVRWMAWSATGVEFIFKGEFLGIEFVADNTVEMLEKCPRIGVFVDGERYIDFQVTTKHLTRVLFDEDTEDEMEKEHVIRIVKLSEAAESTIGFAKLLVDDKAVVQPTKPAEKLIEFIGDSITCGYGIDGTLEDTFSTANEDATKAYAYQTAQNLKMDVSLISISGHGIISGYTEEEVPNIAQLITPYYKTLGKSYEGRFASKQDPGELTWDFSKLQPDAIVINLGTNDASYCKEEAERKQHYMEEYIQLIKMVRECNPDAMIVCSLGIMDQRLVPYVERAVEQYQAETKDTGVCSFLFDIQLEEDGYAVDWHPSPVTHAKAAKALTNWLAKNEHLT